MLREYLPFWARLTEGQQRRLEEGAAVRRFARGEMVYGGGTECAGLILPTEGQLRAYMLTDEGRELTLYRLFPRDMCLFSASCVLRGIQFDVLVEAERDTTALFQMCIRDSSHTSLPSSSTIRISPSKPHTWQ